MYSLDNNDFLSRLDSIRLHLKHVHPILLYILCLFAFAGQLASLSDWHESGVQTHGDDRSQQETTGVEPDDHVWEVTCMRVEDVIDEVGDECFERDGITEDGEDVEEGDALMLLVGYRAVGSRRQVLASLGNPGWTPRSDLR
jgi:hypothetical protein